MKQVPKTRKLVIAWTGHRPDKLGGFCDSWKQEWVREQIRSMLKKLKPISNNIGMALGFDTWVAEECIDAGIPFEAYVAATREPNPKWPESSKQHYFELLDKAAFVHIVAPGPYEPTKLQRRNEAMVRNANYAVACWDGSDGGTGNCVNFIERYRYKIGEQNYGFHIIDPRTCP